MGRLLALIGALAAALLLAWADARSPAARPASAPVAEFSASRAMADVNEIARRPHPMGTAENRRVRDYLVARMTTLGLAPAVRADDALSFSERPERVAVSGGRVENIVGVLPGRDRTAPAVALMAHYDSVPGSPGAADDAAGVASALEIIRALRAQGAPARDVMVVLTDGEESGLLGARAFFQRDPLAKRIGLVLNMETRGNGGRVQMFETSTQNGPLIEFFKRSAVRPASSSLSVFVYENMPNGTDFTEAKAAGIAGLNYAFIGRQFDYHSPTSTPQHLDQGSLQDMGDQVLPAARAAAFASALPTRGEDLVYSQVAGDWIVSYPAWGGWLVLALAIALIAVGAVRARRIEAFPWTDALRGAGAFLFAVLGAATVLHVARRATGAGLGYFDQRFLLAQVTLWEATIALLALGILVISACELARGRRNIAILPLAVGIASSAFGGFDAVGLGLGVVSALLALVTYTRPVTRPGAWIGVLIVGALLTLGAQIAAPATAFMFAWPLLLASIGAAATGTAAIRRLPYVLLLGVLCALGLAWLAGAAHVLFLGLDLPQLQASMVAIAALLVWPLAQPEEGAPPARRVGLLILLAGLGALVLVREGSLYTARHPQAGHVVYDLDQDTRRAWRTSLYLEPSPWTRRALQDAGGQVVERPHWLQTRPAPSAPDKAVDLPAPTITLAGQEDGSLLLNAVPPAGARELHLQLRSNTGVTIEQVASLPVRLAPKPGTWARINWEAAPQGTAVRLRPVGPGKLDVRYVATTDGWPAGVKPLPPRPADEMPFHTSDSTMVSGTRSFSW